MRRSVEAAQGDLDASVENLRDVLVSLLAEVGDELCGRSHLPGSPRVCSGKFEGPGRNYQLTEWQYRAGLSDELAVQQARYNLETTRSQIPSLRTGLENTMNRISVLLGEKPGAVQVEMKEPAPVPTAPLRIVVGIPADVLRRRPDVRTAERQLAAQTARVGVAMADLYPKLTFSGTIGLEATSLGGISDSIIKMVTGGAALTWPIFRGSALRQKVEVQSALQEQAIIKYESTVLKALEEVEDAIAAYAHEQQRRTALREAEEAARSAAELAGQKYKAGLSGFVDVLDAQRSLLSLQDQLVQSQGAVITDLIKLYKALGGGWESLLPSDTRTGAKAAQGRTEATAHCGANG